MPNKRVSELNELLNTQVAANDLMLITDVSAVESKKIRMSQLQTYSLNGTASYVLSASYALSSSHVVSASYAPNGISASYALSASYADWAKSACIFFSTIVTIFLLSSLVIS